jgi:uncharacterized protein (DUF58 family)
MLSSDLLKKVRAIEITTRRMVNDQLAGQYHSVYKGRGMSFDDVRQYQPGDDVRQIDWNVSARSGDLFVKRFVEERELTVMLLVDASGSLDFGTRLQLKRERAAEIAALLAFSAIRNNDRVGLIAFTDRVEHFVPPRKGRKHVLRVVADVLSLMPRHGGTDLRAGLDFLHRIAKRRAVTFLLSDFLCDMDQSALAVAARRHDLTALVVRDPFEKALPPLGFSFFEDAETGAVTARFTSSDRVRGEYARRALEARASIERTFHRLNIDFADVSAELDCVKALARLFVRRARRQ